MPEDYYCADNFFKKMTDLDSPKKNNDCYFYYYSTCAKGDSCTFRHEPSALGCETMCSFWKEGKCVNVHCNFRHMELRKNRKVIPCYWESQPVGCLKPHCPFMHQNAKANAIDESLENKTDSGTESADNTMNEKMNQMNEQNFKNKPVDSLVVNFEEESDNESAPTNSPNKSGQVKVKTLEEIKLEKIQAESAAYYSYSDENSQNPDDLRQRILQRMKIKQPSEEERAQRKRSGDVTNLEVRFKRQKLSPNVDKIKIKTLDEIRAERAKKTPDDHMNEDVCDSSVSSTIEEDLEQKQQKKKIKLKRIFVTGKDVKSNEQVSTNSTTNDNSVDSDTNKSTMIDEVLLLADDDDTSNVSLKAEDELLNEIDDLLDD